MIDQIKSSAGQHRWNHVATRMTVVLLMIAGITACGVDRAPHTAEGDDSSLHYIPFGNVRTCGLAKARAPIFKVCIEPGAVSDADVAKAEEYTSHSMLTWLRALRQIDPKVTSKVEFDCKGAHIRMRMSPGNGTATAGCGIVNMFAERPYGTYLHELGHAFAALGDTYASSAGSCQPGQPRSVMCWGAFNPNKDAKGFGMLFDDDVAGLHANYKQLYTDTTTPDPSINPLGPLDVANPWPGSGSGSNGTAPQGTPVTPPLTAAPALFIAMGSASTQNPQEMGLFVSAPTSIKAVLACTDSVDPTACAKDTSKAISARLVKQENGRNIFSLDRAIAPQSFSSRPIVIFGFATQGTTGAAAAERRVRFVAQ